MLAGAHAIEGCNRGLLHPTPLLGSRTSIFRIDKTVDLLRRKSAYQTRSLTGKTQALVMAAPHRRVNFCKVISASTSNLAFISK